MQFAELIAKRYSLRYFDPTREVPKALVDTLIDSAILAPTAHNRQAFHLYQLQGEGLAFALKDVTSSHFAAPLVLVLAEREEAAWRRRDGYSNSAVDIGIVGTHIMLMAEHLGLGSCWVGSFDAAKLSDLLSLEDGLHPVAMFPIGYPSDRARPGPLHSLRKSKEELVTKIDF